MVQFVVELLPCDSYLSPQLAQLPATWRQGNTVTATQQPQRNNQPYGKGDVLKDVTRHGVSVLQDFLLETQSQHKTID